MTDLEIFKWLYELEPESKEQEKKLNKMMSIILTKSQPIKSKLETFIDTLMLDDVLGKDVSRVYEYYCDWCKDNAYTPESKIAFGRKMCATFKVKSVVIMSSGIRHRVYELEEL